jgi:hypothetical protein
MRHFVLALLCAAGLAVSASPALAESDDPLAGLTEVGRGELTWFGFNVYDAHLYTASGEFRDFETAPVALEIRYERSIESRQLVETTRKEWRRLAGALNLRDPALTERWLEAVGRIWPNVEPGERIVTILDADGATRFYGTAGYLGTIEDPGFGPALLGIWLHPETRVADLRADLIGGVE